MRLAFTWKRLSIYPYYLVIINMLFFNRKLVTFILRTVLESNQVLTYVFKNVKILSKCESQRVEL